jgi:hypothetical protein
MLKHRPLTTTPPRLIGVVALPSPSLVEVEPTGQHQVGLFGERIAVRVGKFESPFVVEKDSQRTVVHITVTGDADSEEVVGQRRAPLGIGYEMVKVEPDFVRTAGGSTAPTSGGYPTLATKNLFLLSLGGVPVVRIEANLLVLNGWEDVFQGSQVVGSGPRGGATRVHGFLGGVCLARSFRPFRFAGLGSKDRMDHLMTTRGSRNRLRHFAVCKDLGKGQSSHRL